jgi:3-methyladenine DNA glycosylase/8-oxoguanine DNA glycosylase
VRSEAEAEEEARSARASLNAIPGIGDINAELLFQWGYRSAEQLAEADEESFEVEGISPERAAQLIAAARSHVLDKKKREAEARAAAELKDQAEAEAAEAVAAEAAEPEESAAEESVAEASHAHESEAKEAKS